MASDFVQLPASGGSEGVTQEVTAVIPLADTGGATLTLVKTGRVVVARITEPSSYVVAGGATFAGVLPAGFEPESYSDSLAVISVDADPAKISIVEAFEDDIIFFDDFSYNDIPDGPLYWSNFTMTWLTAE